MPALKQQVKFLLGAEYGIDPVRITKIEKGVANDNYYVQGRQDSYICKIYINRTTKEIQFELNVLEHLAKKKFSGPIIFKTLKGKSYAVLQSNPCVVLRYIVGNRIDRITRIQLYKIGSNLSTLHLLLRGIRPGIQRVQWDLDDIKKMLPRETKQIIQKRFPQAKMRLSFLSEELGRVTMPNTLPKGITHQDVKPDNIIRDSSGTLHFIDFDNSYYGVLLYDFMTPVIWTCFKKGKLQPMLLKSLVQGYESIRRFSSQEKECMFDALRFRLLREVLIWMMLYNTQKARRYASYFMNLYNNVISQENLINRITIV